MNSKRIAVVIMVISTTLFTGACSSQLTQAEASGPTASLAGTQVVDMSAELNLDTLIPRLTGKRVVYVGETHDAYGHHLNQLDVIRALHRRNPRLAIGMEFFQQPFQQALDDYIAGRIEEKQMLRQSEWYERWRYDYRLYRPLLQYAREHAIPVIALNIARELTDRVSEVGIDALEPSERAQIPAQLDASDTRYRERIRSVYEHHPGKSEDGFERFLQVQLTWDEGMAERVVRYLNDNPEHSMVVLAGSGHLMYGDGIPARVSRRMTLDSAILLPADRLKIEPGIADYLLYPKSAELPEAGMMGVMLEDHAKGVRVSGVVPGSAAATAGLEKGDIIRTLNGESVASFVDIKLGLLGKSPGDPVSLELLRPRLVLEDELLVKRLTLGGRN